MPVTNILLHDLRELFDTSGPSTSGFAFGRWLIASALGAMAADLLVGDRSAATNKIIISSSPSLGSTIIHAPLF